MKTIVRDRENCPKVTLTAGDDGTFSCVVEVQGLAPTRAVSVEEGFRGWTSLDPPTVSTMDPRKLVDEAVACTLASVADTMVMEPDHCSMIVLRVATEVRRGLYAMGYQT